MLIDPQNKPALAAGEALFKLPCTFVKGVVALDQLPGMGLEEVAIIGRSNVGKSSLINALTNRIGLARVSNTPGRTQELNFFTLGEKMYLVDLPGYGYAEAPKEKVDQWTRLIRAYLRGRQTLRRVCVLIDSRHGPKKADLEFFDLLDEAGVAYQLILTKIDKIRDRDLPLRIAECEAAIKKRAAAHPQVLATSSEKRLGLELVKAALATLDN